MDMKNFELNGDILTVTVTIDGVGYWFSTRWKAPEKPYGDTWFLETYANQLTGKRDLSQEKITEFLNLINPRKNWDMSYYETLKRL